MHAPPRQEVSEDGVGAGDRVFRSQFNEIEIYLLDSTHNTPGPVKSI